MSIPYIIILSDSEDEDEPMVDADIPSDPDNESNNSNTTWGSSEEEDPSEDEAILETPPQSPETPSQSSETAPWSAVHWTYDMSGPHTIRTRGKSVAGAHRTMAPPSESSLRTDPYVTDRVWNYLPTTLREWRKEEKIPSITEVGESSTAPHDFPFTQEPPHHTVPLLVTRAIRHEDRLDHIEDALLEMPGNGEVGDIQYQIGCLDDKMESVKKDAEDLKQKAMQRDIGNAALEGRLLRRMDELEARLDTLADALRDFTTFIAKGGHIPKK